jgi:hypothetical protein
VLPSVDKVVPNTVLNVLSNMAGGFIRRLCFAFNVFGVQPSKAKQICSNWASNVVLDNS